MTASSSSTITAAEVSVFVLFYSVIIVRFNVINSFRFGWNTYFLNRIAIGIYEHNINIILYLESLYNAFSFRVIFVSNLSLCLLFVIQY